MSNTNNAVLLNVDHWIFQNKRIYLLENVWPPGNDYTLIIIKMNGHVFYKHNSSG